MEFFSPDGDGMLSVVLGNRPFSFLYIKHIGCRKNGLADTASEEDKNWDDAFENHYLSESNSQTQVNVEMDVTIDYQDFIAETCPKALERLKELYEQ